MTISMQLHEVNKTGNFRVVEYSATLRTGRLVNLPQEIGKDAGCRLEFERYHMSTRSKGRKNGKNKDRIGLFTSDNVVALVLADGYGNSGDSIACVTRDNIGRELFEKQISLGRDMDPDRLVGIVREALAKQAITQEKTGASLSVLVLNKDGKYMGLRIGNCPVYIVENDVPTRLGSEEMVRLDGEEGPFLWRPSLLTAERYFENEGNLVTAIRKGELNTSSLDVFTGQLSAGNNLIVVSSGLVRNMPIAIDPSGKVTDSSRCYSVHDAINGAGGLDEIAQRLVDIEIMQERELRISGGLAYRQVDKDRSVVVISFN